MTQNRQDGNEQNREARTIDLDGPQPLILVVGGQRHEVAPRDTHQRGFASQWIEQHAGVGRVVVDIRHLLSWQDDDRRDVLRFIMAIVQRLTVDIVTQTDGAPHADMFAAVLSLMVGSGDTDRCARGVRAATESAALTHADAIEPACQRICARLSELDVRGYNQRSLIVDVREMARTLRPAGAEPQPSGRADLVRAVIEDAPVPELAEVPPGWRLTATGVYLNGGGAGVPVTSAPVVITRRLGSLENGTQSLEVAWHLDGNWQSRVVDRLTLAGARTIVGLAAFGFPVTSNNAADVVDYVASFEAHNLNCLPSSLVSQALGWQGHNGFLWGRTHIVAPRQSQNVTITFCGLEAGDEQLANGLHAAGTLEGWRNVVSAISAYPRAQFGLYASLAAPLLHVVNTPNFVVSFAGPTSVGKTTELRVDASCWGIPDLAARSAAIMGWDSTRAFIERAASLMNSMPLILDDTKVASSPEEVAQTVYQYTQGRGRGRATLHGMQQSGIWQGVLISSGEGQLAEIAQHGGMRARILEIWGSPFGEPNDRTVELVAHLNEGVMAHYGHAGPALVHYLLANRSQWETWREQFQAIRRRYQQQAGRNTVAVRMAANFAVLELAAIIAHEAIALPWGYQGTIQHLWGEITAGSGEADRAAAALRYVLSWAHSRRGQFVGVRGENMSNGECLGRWEAEARGAPDAATLCLYPHILDRVLRDGGFDPAAIRRQWCDRRWLRTNPGKTTLKVRVSGPRPQEMVAILWSAIEEQMGGCEDEG